jgi:hypothetical protein
MVGLLSDHNSGADPGSELQVCQVEVLLRRAAGCLPLRLWVFPDLSASPLARRRFRVSVTDTGLRPEKRAISFRVGVGRE